MKKSSFKTLGIVLVFLLIGFVLIAYARGLRIDFKNKKIQTTGLLVATSTPDGASVYLNDHLTTATNSTINLTPGDYRVRIVKEGYLSWQKTLKIQQEIVAKTDAVLFPSTPELKPLTVNGALNPSLSPDGSRLLYSIKSPNNSENIDTDRSGLYILDMLDRPLSFSRSTRRIVKNTPFFDFSQAKYLWSPDSKFVIAIFSSSPKNDLKEINADNVATAFLLSTDSENPNPKDITPTMAITLKQWQTDREAKYQDQLASLPVEFLKFATVSATTLKFSPDETKILYEATASAKINPIIRPPLIGASSQKEEREIKSGKTYVYDLKEDKNFLMPANNLSWFPDSKHLIQIEGISITIQEYDSTNKVTVYSGPFEDSFVFPWPNGTKLVILTTLNKGVGQANLYSLGLK